MKGGGSAARCFLEEAKVTPQNKKTLSIWNVIKTSLGFFLDKAHLLFVIFFFFWRHFTHKVWQHWKGREECWASEWWRSWRRQRESLSILFLWQRPVCALWVVQSPYPTNNALFSKLPPELRCRNFVDKCRLSIQIDAKRAKTRVHYVVCSDWASILHSAVGGWVLYLVRWRGTFKELSLTLLMSCYSFFFGQGKPPCLSCFLVLPELTTALAGQKKRQYNLVSPRITRKGRTLSQKKKTKN